MFNSRADKLGDAAGKGDLETVRRMIEGGVDVNAKDFFKATALQWAAAKGRAEVVKYLLSRPGIDVSAMNAGGTTALMTACRFGHLEVVNLLLAHPGVDANQLGKWGGTALMNAAGFGHKHVVERLLQIDGISLEATYTDKKYSPLTLARQNGHHEVAAIIEKHLQARQKPATPKPPAP